MDGQLVKLIELLDETIWCLVVMIVSTSRGRDGHVIKDGSRSQDKDFWILGGDGVEKRRESVIFVGVPSYWRPGKPVFISNLNVFDMPGVWVPIRCPQTPIVSGLVSHEKLQFVERILNKYVDLVFRCDIAV